VLLIASEGRTGNVPPPTEQASSDALYLTQRDT
jgi:hypothetical protein